MERTLKSASKDVARLGKKKIDSHLKQVEDDHHMLPEDIQTQGITVGGELGQRALCRFSS